MRARKPGSLTLSELKRLADEFLSSHCELKGDVLVEPTVEEFIQWLEEKLQAIKCSSKAEVIAVDFKEIIRRKYENREK